jgi:hypothetical protein
MIFIEEYMTGEKQSICGSIHFEFENILEKHKDRIWVGFYWYCMNE